VLRQWAETSKTMEVVTTSRALLSKAKTDLSRVTVAELASANDKLQKRIDCGLTPAQFFDWGGITIDVVDGATKTGEHVFRESQQALDKAIELQSPIQAYYALATPSPVRRNGNRHLATFVRMRLLLRRSAGPWRSSRATKWTCPSRR